MMSSSEVTVEFLGIVRQRTNCAEEHFFADSLRELYAQLGERFPQLEGVCVEDGELKSGYLASIGGRRFTRSGEESLSPGDRVLLLSADAGG